MVLGRIIFLQAMAIIASLILFWQITVDVDRRRGAERSGRVMDIELAQKQQATLTRQSEQTTQATIAWRDSLTKDMRNSVFPLVITSESEKWRGIFFISLSLSSSSSSSYTWCAMYLLLADWMCRLFRHLLTFYKYVQHACSSYSLIHLVYGFCYKNLSARS